MTLPTAKDWRAATEKRVLLFGMSGLGKTHVSNILRGAGDWFHYSIDYRIGTRYMNEAIVDNFKREAMRNPFLANLLKSDSIYIASNLTFDNLSPLSTYLGKPGNPELGGLPFAEYLRRQEQHRVAEVSALLDTGHFIRRAKDIYRYDNFICDSGGSICEVVDPWDEADPVLVPLAEETLMVWIEDTAEHRDALIARFDRAPKPMYYQPAFLAAQWDEYLASNGLSEAEVDPDAFIRWTYARALAHRRPRYKAMAENWGISVKAGDVARVQSQEAFEDLIARALEERG
ncbi:ATPase [Poseidonocella sp. HB161398]|uniref:ATPase n=1 Tax=Poseidonocella sp. HB161398 TaxID=2320855 RepID=UPI001108F218|nr:ATPase [Poseidonocella sp. HB161398]